MKLSDRLEMVVSFVEPAKAAADIGTDHGHVPVELVRRGIAERAFAMDVRKGPLSRAEENIRISGLSDRIAARLSDGTERLAPGEADAVIIAGMGGELMIHILERSSHIWSAVDQWVLSPHSEIPKVRRWLWENGFPVKREAMVLEDGNYYTVMDVRRKEERNRSGERDEKSFVYGEFLAEARDPVFLSFLKEEENSLCRLMDKLRAQENGSERAAASLKEIGQRLSYNREVQNEMQRNH